MKLKQFLNKDIAYTRAEDDIKAWVEAHYEGLSIDFDPHLEIVRTGDKKYSAKRTRKITEAVNIKIGNILEAHADEIYIGERLDRIWKKHPDFDFEVETINDIKQNAQFIQYLEELIVR